MSLILKRILVGLTFVVFLAAMVVNALAALRENYDIGLFNYTTGDISDKYILEITPAGWTFSIWGAIYFFQVLFVFYSIGTVCACCGMPSHIPAIVYILYIINLGCNMAWLITFDREWMEASLGLAMAMSFTLYIAIGVTMCSLHAKINDLADADLCHHIGMTISFVLNGLGIYAAWVSIATLLNMAIVLSHTQDVFSMHIASSVSLGALAFEFILYVVLDLVIFERHFRYVFTPLIVLHIALAGILVKNWDVENSNTIFTIALLGCGAVALIIKVANALYRSCKNTRTGDMEKR